MKNTPSPVSSRRGLILTTLLLLVVVAAMIGAALSLVSSSPFATARRAHSPPGDRRSNHRAGRPAQPGDLAGGGRAGDTHHRRGPRLAAGDTVLIRLEAPGADNATNQEMASAIVSDRGEFSVRFAYPDTRPWDILPVVQVIAVDETAHQRVSTPFRMTAAQLMTLTPTPTETATATECRPYPPRPLPPGRRGQRQRHIRRHRLSCPRSLPGQRLFLGRRLHPGRRPRRAHGRAADCRAADRRHRLAWGILRRHQSLGQPALIRNDAAIDFNWGLGSPAPGLPADNFSARWQRRQDFDTATYRFYLRVDDGAARLGGRSDRPG